jgi:hypothetical protein
VVVVDVKGLSSSADGAYTSLLEDHPFHLNGVNLVAAFQLKSPAAAVVLLDVVLSDACVTRLAVIAAPLGRGAMARKVLQRFHFPAAGAAPRTDHALSRYSMAEAMISGSSRNAPRPALHRRQRIPRTAPVWWSWST